MVILGNRDRTRLQMMIHPWAHLCYIYGAAQVLAASRSQWTWKRNETTGRDLKPRRREDARSKLVLDLVVTESHTWYGIGGRKDRVRRTRRLTRVIPVLPLDVSSAAGCPGYLRGGAHCRRLIGRVMRHSLRHEEEYGWLSPADWDRAVPRDVERRIALAAAARGGDTTRDVRVRVALAANLEFVYSEPKELLRACVGEDEGDLAGTWDGDGAAPSCPICMEEMSPEAEATMHLPGCAHGFHRSCMSRWFSEASTCPMCRRDMIQYLPLDYRELHDMMPPPPDILPD